MGESEKKKGTMSRPGAARFFFRKVAQANLFGTRCKEFLTSSRIACSSGDVSAFHILLEPAHTVLAEACLAVLLRLGELLDEDNVDDKFPLAHYAAEHLVDHARFEN